MRITSKAFENNQIIPTKYTCDGRNINPPLEFHDIPVNTKSLALIMDDPDAPIGLWVHWVLWNILPNISNIIEDQIPAGSSIGLNSSKQNQYSGPCPPDREHRYFFKLYALDTVLNLPINTDKNALEKVSANHIIAQAELMGRYNRQN